MKTALLATALAATCLFAAPAISSAAVSVPVTFVPTGKTAPAVTGTFTINKFQNINGSLFAVGTVSYKSAFTSIAVPVTSVNGMSTQSASSSVTSAAAAATAACPVLNLVLGPLNLNLLGLQVTLNQVTLDITAIPGAGNLLGNLLCDVAGLLNPGGGLSSILDELVTVLNQVLSSL